MIKHCAVGGSMQWHFGNQNVLWRTMLKLWIASIYWSISSLSDSSKCFHLLFFHLSVCPDGKLGTVEIYDNVRIVSLVAIITKSLNCCGSVPFQPQTQQHHHHNVNITYNNINIVNNNNNNWNNIPTQQQQIMSGQVIIFDLIWPW